MYELTHVYQQEPQGIGSYGTNREFRAFIEGMADALSLIHIYSSYDRVAPDDVVIIPAFGVPTPFMDALEEKGVQIVDRCV